MMEKMSRMRKYQDLRENIKNDVITGSPTVKNYTFSQEDDQSVQIKTPDQQDTLLEGMTIDTINNQKNEQLERALNRVREESGQEENFDTRMDILNKIRQTQVEPENYETIEETNEQPSFRFEAQQEVEEPSQPVVSSRQETAKESVEEDVNDEEDEENPTYVKVLNGIIILLAIILVGLIGYIVKEFVF